MHFSIDRTVHTTAFDKPVVDHWLEQKIAQTAAGSTEKDQSDFHKINIFRFEIVVKMYVQVNDEVWSLFFSPFFVVSLSYGKGPRIQPEK